MPVRSIEIDDVWTIGGIQDEPGYALAPEAWSLTNNVRVQDGSMRRLFGWSQIFGSGPLVEGPYFLMYVASASQPWWLWASLDNIYVYDGVGHTEISKTHNLYSATGAANWNGTILGGIPILNEGNHPPQFWNSYSILTKMADLVAWPAATLCRVIRAFGPFLVALNITKSGNNTPHRVLWSTEASPGSLPASWDVTDPTVDAGQNDLPDIDSGQIVDGLTLQGAFYIYKEASVWRMRFIGGRFVFAFESFLDTAGLLTTRCACMTGDGQNHVFISQDDMIMHNGNSATPLLEKKFKRYLFNQIDTSNYQASFMFSNPLFSECWFCYPQQGSSLCNRALIFNWKYNTFTEADIDFQSAAVGTTSTASGVIWSAATIPWSSDLLSWNLSARRRTIIGNPTTQKIHLFDSGATRDGASYVGLVQRTGLGLTGRDQAGKWTTDFQQVKMINRLWPKIVGGPVNIRAGYQRLVNGPTTWLPSQTFDPNINGDPARGVVVDGLLGSGRAIGLEFSSTNDFRLDGYKIDLALLGKF